MLKKSVLLIMVVFCIILLRNSPYADIITFDYLKTHADELKYYVHGHYAASVLMYLAGYFVFTAFALPGAIVLSLFGGYVFGVAAGLPMAICASTAGASAAFFMSRYLFGGYIQSKYAVQLDYFNNELSANGHLYMLTLRLIPIFPFFLINILAGLTKIPFRTFLWTTAAGMFPAGFVIFLAGSRLSEINSPGDIFSQKMLIVLVLFGALALLPVIYNKIRSK
ncbi:TVP38/TMEM64 family protein [Seleniivibrio woodruffii]|uniref:TVP38/TMEM64 family protein n=1 Tax=Seleniivibrio woodruffii TaxID=1078050 RepID=UPI002409E82E|nr:VTT domain-containing protein [Seleniivibrio woodruffii]